MSDNITFNVERDGMTDRLLAYWINESAPGGLTVQGQDVHELQSRVKETVRRHFEKGQAPRSILLYFVHEQVYVPVK